MFKPPAHKCTDPGATAGQTVNKVTQEDIDKGPHAGLGTIPSDYEEGWKPPRYLRDVIKAAQERSSEELATTPSTTAEKRLEGVERALWSLIRDIELRNGRSTNWYSNELKKILQENS